MKKHESLYVSITQHIVTAIESGQVAGTWTMPWHTTGAPGTCARNAATCRTSFATRTSPPGA